MRSLSFLLFLLPIFALALACGADDGRPGSGTGGGTGGGTGTGTDENESKSATEPRASSPAEAAKKANAEGPCATDAECASGVCFVGGSQTYCSARCTLDDAVATCAAPFTGTCNKQGFCKRD
jgi:hypothetical protein